MQYRYMNRNPKLSLHTADLLGQIPSHRISTTISPITAASTSAEMPSTPNKTSYGFCSSHHSHSHYAITEFLKTPVGNVTNRRVTIDEVGRE